VKLKQVIIVVVIVILTVIGYVTYMLIDNLDEVVKVAIETYGSEAIGANVRLDSVKIDLIDGRGSLSGLVVGNPQGFKTENAFELGNITIVIDLESITKDPIVIKEVTILNPVVTYEMASGGSNIAVIQKNLGSGSAGSETTDEQNQGPKIVINDLFIKNATVNVSHSVLKGKKLSSGIADIHMTGIGVKEGGAGYGEVANRIVNRLTNSVGSVVAGMGLNKMMENVSGKVEDLFKKAKEGGSSLNEKVGDVSSKFKQGFGEAGDKFKNIFQ